MRSGLLFVVGYKSNLNVFFVLLDCRDFILKIIMKILKYVISKVRMTIVLISMQ